MIDALQEELDDLNSLRATFNDPHYDLVRGGLGYLLRPKAGPTPDIPLGLLFDEALHRLQTMVDTRKGLPNPGSKERLMASLKKHSVPPPFRIGDGSVEVRPLLTSKDVANLLSLNRETVRRWTREGRIPSVRLGPKCYRYRPEEIERWVETQFEASRRDVRY